MNGEMFEAWLRAEGRPMLRESLRNTRFRWCFGNRRAKRRLRRAARTAFRPGGTFSLAMVRQLNRLPVVVRGCAAGIQKTGYRQLCTFDAEKNLSVVPRGVVQYDFKALMVSELAGMAQVREFSGLTERVLAAAALEAERALFDVIAKGRQLVDDTGRGMIMGADRDFRWKLNGSDGHYYYAASLQEGADLTNSRDRRRFLAAMRELYQGQTVHLKRMRVEEISETRETFRIRQTVESGNGPATMTIRVRKTRETEETILTRSF
ncbi:MAG TPA: hypothetical protein VFT13_13435 [Candidatus Krumholzibacteria bacterium]|nr:hypothetical protein [Candidatus Krumholzibacteria bacterium]